MIQIPVVSTVILPEGTVTDVTALVCQRWLDLRLTADLSVSTTRTVPQTRPADSRSVRILVLDSVVSTPTAMSETIFQSVSVIKDM